MIKYENQNASHDVLISKFPGGEVKVNIPTLSVDTNVKWVHVIATLRNSDEVMELVMVTNALKIVFPVADFSLCIPYIPYARQDRVCNKGESHSLKAFSQIINMLGYIIVNVADPHSDVAGALIDNCNVIKQCSIMNKIGFDQFDAIISPDAGAQKKAYEVAKKYGVKQVITANKVRDPATGRIIKTELNGSVDGLNVLVVDDICDGGATFIHLSNELIKAKTKKLYVTHGIFSKGVEAVTPFYDMIYTTDSYNPDLKSSEKLKIVHNFY